MLNCLGPVLFTFYIQGVLKLKKIIPAPKGLKKLNVQASSPKCRRVTTKIQLINLLNLWQISNAEGH
jgi:hypothetical protein